MTTTQPGIDAMVARIRGAVDKIPQPSGAWHKHRQTIDIDESEEWCAVRVQVHANKLVGPKVAAYIAAVSPDVLAALLAHMEGLAKDAARLDALEHMANQPGGILLHDGSEQGKSGLGLRPGSLVRTLREAVDATGLPEKLTAAAMAEGAGE